VPIENNTTLQLPGLIQETHTDVERPYQPVNVRRWTWAARTYLADRVMHESARTAEAGKASAENSDGFAGCTSHQAIQRARDGWPEGVGQLNAALDSLAPKQTDGDAQAMDVSGYAVCIGAYVAGDPECMFALQETPDAKPIISLFYQASYNCGVSVTSTTAYAAALTSLIADLDAQGISTAIYAAAAHYVDSGRYISELDLTTIREPGDALDLSKVAFSMSAPMHRRIQFALWEGIPGIHSTMNKRDYGLNADLCHDQGEYAREIVMEAYPGAIFLPWIGELTHMGRHTLEPQEALNAMRAVVLASGFKVL
jgi:hypothetical protein